MPNLGDYIGQLLAEITVARVQADLEAVRVAELYASHPLLRHLPVPHFRLPTLTLDVPVVIQRMEEPKKGEGPRGTVPLGPMREAFDRLLAAELSQERLRLTDAEQKLLKRFLDRAMKRAARPADIALGVGSTADLLVSAVTEFLSERDLVAGPLEPKHIEAMGERLRADARREFLNLRPPPPRLQVLVTTAEVKEAGPPDILARFRLTVSEEGVEWTVITSDGKTQERLVPE
jgi:hypothetical protein